MFRYMLGILAAAGLLMGTAAGANPPGHPERSPQFQKNHPRQTEVLKRTDRERNRINKAYKDGKITAQQRDQMLSEVKSVRKEDFSDAKANSSTGTVRGDSYITKDQQRVMNQQENQINQEIRRAGGK